MVPCSGRYRHRPEQCSMNRPSPPMASASSWRPLNSPNSTQRRRPALHHPGQHRYPPPHPRARLGGACDRRLGRHPRRAGHHDDRRGRSRVQRRPAHPRRRGDWQPHVACPTRREPWTRWAKPTGRSSSLRSVTPRRPSNLRTAAGAIQRIQTWADSTARWPVVNPDARRRAGLPRGARPRPRHPDASPCGRSPPWTPTQALTQVTRHRPPPERRQCGLQRVRPPHPILRRYVELRRRGPRRHPCPVQHRCARTRTHCPRRATGSSTPDVSSAPAGRR